MEKFTRINLLYDFYGQLLTERQGKFIELYYSQNLSLGEIAEDYPISRQAIRDVLKRAENTLFQYEEKMGLVQKFLNKNQKLREALTLLDSENGKKIERVRKIIEETLEIV